MAPNNNENKQNESLDDFKSNSSMNIQQTKFNNVISHISNSNINSENFKSKNNIINYESYNSNIKYYLVCPECALIKPKIQNITYDSVNKDFIITYICPCNNNQNKIKKKYFKDLITDKEPKNCCFNHNNELLFFCKNCNIQICDQCKDEHQSHVIENNVIMSEENAKNMLMIASDKKNEFQGIGLLQKLYSYMIENEKNNNDISGFNDGEQSIQGGIIYREKSFYKSTVYAIPENENKEQDINQKEFKNTKTLRGHEEKIIALIQLNNGNIASGGYDSKVCIWDIDQGICLKKFETIGKVLCLLEFEPNMLLTGTNENIITLWDLNDLNDFKFNFIKHELWVNCIVKYDEKYFASAANDAYIYIWDYYNKECVCELVGHKDCILSLIKLNDGNLCSGSADCTIKIWNWQKKSCLTLNQHTNWVKCLCQLNDGTLLSGSDDKTIKVWKENKCILTLEGHKLSVRALCQIDQKHFASGSFDSTIKIWEMNTFKNIQNLEGHSSNVICIIKLKDNRFASCSSDRTIKLWE